MRQEKLCNFSVDNFKAFLSYRNKVPSFYTKDVFFSFLFCSNFAQIHCAKFSPLFSLIKKDQSWKVNITLVGVLCLLRAPLNFDGKQLGFEICTDIIFNEKYYYLISSRKPVIGQAMHAFNQQHFRHFLNAGKRDNRSVPGLL